MRCDPVEVSLYAFWNKGETVEMSRVETLLEDMGLALPLPKAPVANYLGTKRSGNMIGFYGSEFASALASRPSSAFIADGSPVTVRKGKRIDMRIVV